MKEAYYFSHDANAQHDPKIIKMLSKYGWESYGIYWALIERLRNEPSYKLECDYDCLSYALRVDKDIIKGIVLDYNLFEVHDGTFWSDSLMKRMLIKKERSQKARQSALKRWKSNAKAKQTQSKPNAINESKVKESKGKEIKRNIFKNPNIDECIEYFKKMKYPDYKNQAEKFFYFYESKGWMVGKNKMKKWKMAAGNWNKNNSSNNNNSVVDLSDEKIKKERRAFLSEQRKVEKRSASTEEIKDIIQAAKKRMVG